MLISLSFSIFGFNPRSPRGGATGFFFVGGQSGAGFQSTLPTRGSDHIDFKAGTIHVVSIHAPHEGERRAMQPLSANARRVSIHAPHEGERRGIPPPSDCCLRFQSTLPTRGSDHFRHSLPPYNGSFNPRSPRGGATLGAGGGLHGRPLFQSTLPTRGSDAFPRVGHSPVKVSIHAPHEGERRAVEGITACTSSCFNPRSPRGGATFYFYLHFSTLNVSIHAPHEGERPQLLLSRGRDCGVSIHAPHEGERPKRFFQAAAWMVCFNPRSPRGGATCNFVYSRYHIGVSIHAPHEGERRLPRSWLAGVSARFNPRSPRGGATSVEPLDRS